MKTTFSQGTQNSTAQQTNDAEQQRRLKLIEALERAQDEVAVSRNYIAGLEAQVKSKQSIIAAQNARQTLSDEAIVSLQKEVKILRRVIAEQDKTIALQSAEVASLKKDLDKTRRKLSRARKVGQFLIIGIGALILTSVLK